MAAKRTNVAPLKGMPAQGSRPAGSRKVLGQGFTVGVTGTKKLPGTVGPDTAPRGFPDGDTTVNSTPARKS